MSDSAPHAEDILDLLKPAPTARAACLVDIIEAIGAIQAPPFQWLRARQTKNVARKLSAALAAIEGLPLAWRYGLEGLRGELDRVSQSFEQLASEARRRPKGGRVETAAYRRKVEAAHQAFVLAIRWGRRAPRLDGVAAVAEVLLEAAGSKPPGDVSGACRQVLGDMRKRGYDPARWRQLRAFVARTAISI